MGGPFFLNGEAGNPPFGSKVCHGGTLRFSYGRDVLLGMIVVTRQMKASMHDVERQFLSE